MTPRPSSTYRLQIRAGFDLDDAAEVVDYLRDLGVDWAYLSPLLRATTGSDHGYDVVDPSQIDPARGGAAGLDRFAAAARSAGLGILVDIVPNHVGVSAPEENPWWWDLLARGRASRYAAAFDVDWAFGGGKVRIPVLGSSVADAVAAAELRVEGDELRYFDHRFPLATGSVSGEERARLAADPADAAVLLGVHDRQHYELMHWRRESSELNYRRFFAVSSLAAIRVEDPQVFDEAHAEVRRWFDEGLVDGLRVDHPDGLQRPDEYLDRLARLTGGAFTLVEKILEPGEQLPPFWPTDGTTGYDALAEFDRVLADPAGERPLDSLDESLRAQTGVAPAMPWHELIASTKRMIAESILRSEVLRLQRDLELDGDAVADAVTELLARFPVYRSYLPAGADQFALAERDARAHRPELAGTFDTVMPLLRDPQHPASLRFQQTSGMVMAKGVEDTAFYRYTRLGTLTEVGADPSHFAVTLDEFHAAQASRAASWPHTMTTLSTHDTKRGEDVRARLAVLAEIPARWGEMLSGLRATASTGHGPFDSLLWQAILGAWPASRERLHAYAEKAAREAGDATNWWEPDQGFEDRMHALVDAAFDDPEASGLLDAFVAEIAPAGWSNSLALKLVQLTAPGSPDVYQGSELWEQSLVDPDNRRPVDFARRRRLLAAIDAGQHPPVDATGAAKLLVVARALRLRRDRPELFTRYLPATVIGPAAEHAIAFDRGGALTVATRLPVGLAARGSDPWEGTTLLKVSEPAVDVLTGRRFDGGEVAMSQLLSDYPVALLVNE